MSLIVTKQSASSVRLEARAEIEEKHMQDKMKKLEEETENLAREKNELTKEKSELHMKLQTEKEEVEKWKARYEQLLAAQAERKFK